VSRSEFSRGPIRIVPDRQAIEVVPIPALLKAIEHCVRAKQSAAHHNRVTPQGRLVAEYILEHRVTIVPDHLRRSEPG
jgi:hypothetical protein